MFKKPLVTSAPWSVPLLVAASFALIEAASVYAPGLVLQAVAPVAAFATLAAFWGGFRVARRRGRGEAMAFASTGAMLVPAAFGCYLVTEAEYARYAFAGTSVLLTSFYLAYLRGIIRNDQRFTAEDFSHLSFSVHVVTAFFAWYAAGALPEYVRFPMPASIAIVALVAFVASAETMRRSGLKSGRALRVAGAFAVMAAQSYAALSFLPTSDFANAAVGTVLFVTGLQATVVYLVPQPAPSPTPFRRQIAFSCLLVAVVLMTARWA